MEKMKQGKEIVHRRVGCHRIHVGKSLIEDKEYAIFPIELPILGHLILKDHHKKIIT